MKKKVLNRWFLLVVFPLIAAVYFYPSLPEQVPIHWNFHNEPDQFAPKIVSLALAMLPAVLCGLFFSVKKQNKKGKTANSTNKVNRKIFTYTLIFINSMYLLFLYASKKNNYSVGFWVSLLTGLLCVCIGNYLPQIERNYWVGVRTPWTIGNSRVWSKTNRIGGRVFVVYGLCIVLFTALKNMYLTMLSIASMVVVFLGLFIYSYIEAKKLK